MIRKKSLHKSQRDHEESTKHFDIFRLPEWGERKKVNFYFQYEIQRLEKCNFWIVCVLYLKVVTLAFIAWSAHNQRAHDIPEKLMYDIIRKVLVVYEVENAVVVPLPTAHW